VDQAQLLANDLACGLRRTQFYRGTTLPGKFSAWPAPHSWFFASRTSFAVADAGMYFQNVRGGNRCRSRGICGGEEFATQASTKSPAISRFFFLAAQHTGSQSIGKCWLRAVKFCGARETLETALPKESLIPHLGPPNRANCHIGSRAYGGIPLHRNSWRAHYIAPPRKPRLVDAARVRMWANYLRTERILNKPGAAYR